MSSQSPSLLSPSSNFVSHHLIPPLTLTLSNVLLAQTLCYQAAGHANPRLPGLPSPAHRLSNAISYPRQFKVPTKTNIQSCLKVKHANLQKPASSKYQTFSVGEGRLFFWVGGFHCCFLRRPLLVICALLPPALAHNRRTLLFVFVTRTRQSCCSIPKKHYCLAANGPCLGRCENRIEKNQT